MSTEENKSIARKFYEEWNKGNLEGIYVLASEDIVDHNPIPGQMPGKARLRQALGMINSAFPDLKITPLNIIAEGDRVVYNGIARGTHKGSLMGMPATGKPVEFAFTDIYRVANGKLVESWHIEDMLTVMMQLGAIPMPGQS